MACNCMEEMDAKLKESNAKLQVTFCFPRDGSPSYVLPYIGVEKIETRKRGSVPIACPTFCPFCGERYVPSPEPKPETPAS